MTYLSVEKQILIINTIVKSLDELVSIMRSTNALSEQIYSTISEILNFLHKVLISLPELLVSDVNIKYKRQDLLDNFDVVLLSWEEFIDDPDIFFDRYTEFSKLWVNFEATLKKIEKSGNTIFLSMN